MFYVDGRLTRRSAAIDGCGLDLSQGQGISFKYQSSWLRLSGEMWVNTHPFLVFSYCGCISLVYPDQVRSEEIEIKMSSTLKRDDDI